MIPIPFFFTKEVYVALGAAGGVGSKTDPLRLPNGDLDPIIPTLGANCRLNLKAGEYLTSGFKAPKAFMIVGEGIDATTIKLKDNVGTKNPYYPHIRIISDNYWSDVLAVGDLTIDCNWQNQLNDSNKSNFKIEAINARVIRGYADNIRVKNFISSAGGYGKLGLECFAIGFTTFTNGEPFAYFPEMLYLKDKEQVTYTQISNCIVEKGTFFDGGYCTACFIKSNMPKEGDRQPFGVRTTTAGLIENNYVNVPGGIAYGAAVSERLIFRNNIAFDCHAGFNYDTGEARNIEIARNQFLDVSIGINYTPYPSSKNVRIVNNVITLTEPFVNKVAMEVQPSYGIKVTNTENEYTDLNYIKIVGPKVNKPTFLVNVPQRSNYLG